MAAPWISWGLAKTRASTALTTGCFLVYNDEPICFITSYRLIRLRNSFFFFSIPSDKRLTGINSLLLVFRRSVALRTIWQILWKISDTLVDDCLNRTNSQAQFVRYFTNRDTSSINENAGFNLADVLVRYCCTRRSSVNIITDRLTTAAKRAHHSNTLERNKVSLRNTADNLR